jgi:hypothetical protein
LVEQLGGRSPARLILEIDIGERVSAMVTDDEGGELFLNDQGGGKRRSAEVIARYLTSTP